MSLRKQIAKYSEDIIKDSAVNCTPKYFYVYI